MTAEVTKSSPSSSSITIPSTVTYKDQTYSVTRIGKKAFYDVHLTSVTIPNSVTTIGDYAFEGCVDLTSIIIPNSVTTIGEGAFKSCGLTSLPIPNSVTKIGDWTFSRCYELTSITIPNSVISIGDFAFASCIHLTSVTIPNSVTKIGDGAFFACYQLKKVTILSSLILPSQFSSTMFMYCNIEDIYCGDSIDVVAVRGTIKNVHRLSNEELELRKPFHVYIQEYVESRINEWQKKGDFEKISDWQQRVNETTRNQQVNVYMKEAQDKYFASYHSKHYGFILGTYDAENEVYLIKDQQFGDLLIPVALDEAQYVYTNWDSCVIQPQVGYLNDKYVILSADFIFPNNKTYTYKPDQNLTYTTADINYNFKPIELPEMQTVTMGGGGIAQASQAPQGITEVVITTPVDLTPMSSVLVSYKNIFGKYEMPDLDIPFPYVVIRMKLTGTPNLIRLAKQSLSLDLGLSYIVEQTVPQDDKILFLVPTGVRNIYLTDGNGQRQLLYSGRLQPNTIYDGTIEVK